MILPVVAYGDPVLKKEAEEIDENYPNLTELISNMFETMYAANGVGLAAPQIGLPIRLFVVDATPFSEDVDEKNPDPKIKGTEDFKRVFINPIIEEENGQHWGFEEGCLSIPKIREEVKRQEKVVISYYDENWELKEEELDGYAARVVQHEYDHVEGILFTDHLSPLKKKMLGRKLKDISEGKIHVGYKMKFPGKKSRR